MTDAQILLERKRNLGLQRPKNELHELYQMLTLYSGNGSSTWIINAAVSMPGTKIRIVYASKTLAKHWQQRYFEIIDKMYPKDASFERIKNNIQFITPSEIKQKNKIHLPIIVDNSCLHLQTFERLQYYEYIRAEKNGGDRVYATCKSKLERSKNELIKLLNSFWILPFRKYIIEKIEEIINI